jgi:hypothetical protein
MGYEALGTPQIPTLLPGNELRPHSQIATSVTNPSVSAIQNGSSKCLQNG